MLALLFPLGLAALVTLTLPALIHLARRSEERRTDFAALRWLRQQPKPRQRLRFDEWPLLMLRLLLLALLALWLARPTWQGEEAPARWLVAAPGIDAGEARAAAARSDEARWLAPGFPPLDGMPPAGEVPVASLLRQLDAELPAGATVTVLVPERLSGLDGERPQLSRAVTWRVLPGAMPATHPVPTAIPSLAVRYVPDRAPGLRYLRAAAVAWQPAGRPVAYDAAPVAAALPDRSNVLVWLVPGPLSASVVDWIRRGGTALVDAAAETPEGARVVAWHDPSGVPLVEAMALGRGRLLQLRQPLTPAALPLLLEPDFPRRLRDLLVLPTAPVSARAEDVAPLAGGRRYLQPARDLQPWLAILIALLFAVERWVATHRTRRVSP